MENRNIENKNKTLVRIQLAMPGESLDPIVASDTITREILDNVYEKLFQYDGFELYSTLAQDYVIEDKKIYRMKIRDNVKFHDGTNLDSHIIKLNMERVLRKSARIKLFLGDILDASGIQCLSDRVIQFCLKKAYYDFIPILAIQEASILPMDMLDHPSKMNRVAIGTGPFRLESVNRRKAEVCLVRNEGYWGERPFLDKVKILVEKSYQRRKDMINSNEADIIEVQASKLDDLLKGGNVAFDIFPSLDIILFVFNCNKPPMSDSKVRSAIKEAFDYEGFIKQGRKNLGSRIYAAVPAGLLGHIDNEFVSDEEMEENSVYIYRNYDIKEKVRILSVEGLEDAEIAVDMLGKTLEEMGIQYEVVTLPFDEYSDEQDRGEYDITYLSWAPDVVSPLAYLHDFYHSNGAVARMAGVDNEMSDKSIDSLRENGVDDGQQEKIVQVQKRAEKDNSYMWLYQGKGLKVHSRRIHGVKHNVLDGDYSFKNITKES